MAADRKNAAPLPRQRYESLTESEQVADAIGSYYEAIRSIGELQKTGAPIHPMFRPPAMPSRA